MVSTIAIKKAPYPKPNTVVANSDWTHSIRVIVLSSAGSGQSQYVTCGSLVKLLNEAYKVRLHSHDVKYGSGSGQQSVTATELKDDVNSHWAIYGRTGKHCLRGEPIACGDTIRLHHVSTKKNLHSHHFSSPLSGNQEISCYGDESGEGDSGDHWEVVCSGDYWRRDSKVRFKHTDTDMYLSVSGRTFGRPINGQMEVIGVSSPHQAEWSTVEGVYVHQDESRQNPQAPAAHTEL